MHTIDAPHVASGQIDMLEAFAQSSDAVGPELRDVLLSLGRGLRAGSDVLICSAQRELSPSQAAGRLRMSRTHLYKLLDRGEIPSHRVGRHRRVRAADLTAFEDRREHDRRQLAEDFASQDEVRRSAVDEIAELL